jgi:hypothetical protein
MSSAAMRWAERQAIPDGALKAVLNKLASTSRDGVNAWPSQQTIASSTGLSPRTVWQALRLLDELDLIARKRRSTGRNGRTSDMMTMAVHREFSFTRKEILAAKKRLKSAPATRNPCDLDEKLQLAKSAPATRNPCERIKSDEDLPYQEGNSTEVEGYARHGGEADPHDRDTPSAQVITLPVRGAA